MAVDHRPLLQVEDLKVQFRLPTGILPAVDGIGFTLDRRETLGVVGESGSGKTVSSLALLRLLETPPAEISAGHVLFEGRDLLRLSEAEISDVRGRSIAMIFQEPMTSLNPVMTVGYQIDEALMRHYGIPRREARARTLELLTLVGIPSPERNIDGYPHQLSGGMRQRVMIALALSCEPKILVADEPTTALDVTIQAQILDLMVGLQEKFDTSILLITHDLAVIAETAHRVAVMYAGRIVEAAPVATIFGAPRHPYTQGLLRSIPRIHRQRLDMLAEIPGGVPDLTRLPPGCAFAPRCPRADAHCRQERPMPAAAAPDPVVSCWKAHDG
ncbi:MAG: ABC transporter ATP-binding protein [Alphaproteobacteria bacterium]|nr:ABC transporter ATP-binding protein [Alphaproteobacteria bacterium]